MEKNNGWLLGLLITCLVVGLGTLAVTWNQPEPVNAKDIASQIVIPPAPPAPEAPAVDIDALATAVASKITPTEAESKTETDSSGSDRLCELKNDCKVCFEFDYDESPLAQDELSYSEYRKLKKAVKEITELGVKDYDYFDVELKDSYSYAKTCKEGNKGNFETQLLYRIDYLEEDEDDVDNEILYVLVTTSIEDNEDVSVISTEKVDRKFEIKK